jgi:LacI family transcriptional regulator
MAIAKALGVSRATVSLVLRGGGGASEETQAKVLAMARKMDYRPNALVHSIRSGKSRTVGVLVAPHDSFWKDVCYGIHDRLSEADHLPLFVWDTKRQPDDNERALQQIHRLLDRWVDGVLLWPSLADIYAEHLHEFERRNIPLVAIDHTVPKLTADIVKNDEKMIAKLAVDHITELGHRHILVLPGPPHFLWADQRHDDISSLLKKVKGVNQHTLRPKFGDNVVEAVVQMLQAHPEITAVIAGTDHLAGMVYRATAQLGLTIPTDLSVIGVADLDFVSYLKPALTTIRQDGYEIGYKAAQVELERSAGILIGPPRSYEIPVKLVVRASTSAPKR